MSNVKRRFLIAYDITNDRRRTEVFHTLAAHGAWAQFSVYVCDLTASQTIDLVWMLEDLIDTRVDQIMFVDLGEAKGRGGTCFHFLGPRSDLPTSGPQII